MPQFTDGRTRNIRVWTPADYDKGDATAPYDQVFDSNKQQSKEVKIAFADFDPNNIPTLRFLYKRPIFG